MRDNIDIARLQPEGAFYVFDTAALAARMAKLREALPEGTLLCYAVKANPFIAGEIAPMADRLEICSPGEWEVCAALDLPTEKAVVSGVYKPEAFIRARVEDAGFKGILTVESMRQYEQICRAALETGRRATLLVRITNGSQFGVDEADAEAIIAAREENPLLDIAGVQFFSGTQKTSVKKLRREIESVDMFLACMAEEHGYIAREFEYGPGLPSANFIEDDFDEDAILAGLSEALTGMRFKGRIILELGRGIAACCGRYYTHIVDVKRAKGQNYAITDGGMHQLVYFGQYMAMKHPRFSIVGKEDAPAEGEWNLCGALCSMNDLLVKQAALPGIAPGDLVCFENAGAYCATEGMSLFLTRDLPAVYLRRQDGALVRVRDNFETAPLNTPKYQ